MLQQVVVLVLLAAYGKSADVIEKGGECIDQWGQKGICTNIQSCEIPLRNATVGERIYISGQVCGYEKDPLVCCNTSSSSNEKPVDASQLGSRSETSDTNITTDNKQEIEFTSSPLINEENVNDTTPQNVNTAIESNSIPDVLPLEQPSSPTPSLVDSGPSIPKNTFLNLPTASLIFSPKQINKLLPDREVCGLQNPGSRLENPSISALNEFPWTVLLSYRYGFGQTYSNPAGFRCLGTLISNRYVVTSAGCAITDNESYYLTNARLGEWIISSPHDCIYEKNGQECADNVVDVGIEKRIPHDGYDPNRGLNDIALIRLEKDIQFSDSIRPICLPVEDLVEPALGTILLTSGWAASKYGHQLDIKSKIGLPVLANDSCANQFSNSRQLLENQACVGTTASSNLCLTDSGAAFMGVSQENKPQWYLEGVIPEGFVCNQQNGPETYTRATAYVGWILDTISKDTV